MDIFQKEVDYYTWIYYCSECMDGKHNDEFSKFFKSLNCSFNF